VTSLHPSVHDFEMMKAHLELLHAGRTVRLRGYDHADGTFGAMRTVEPRPVVLVRGLLGFPTTELRKAYDLAVFLAPEPDLLFRWKLRRDVRSRGYREAEVLNYIASHLLDSKEFVLPQGERADLVVRYALPDPEAPDTEITASLTLRRRAAEALHQSLSTLDRFGDAVAMEENGDDVVLHLYPGLPREEVDAWALERFPHTYDPALVGRYQTDEDERISRPMLAFVEVMIARLSQKLPREEHGVREPSAA
jgi:uridine kinase